MPYRRMFRPRRLRPYRRTRFGRGSSRYSRRRLGYGFPGSRTYRRITPEMLKNPRSGGFLGKELKYFNSGCTNEDVQVYTNAGGGEVQPDSGATGTWFAPAQGDGATNREGRRVTVTHVSLNGAFTATPLAGDAVVPDVPIIYIALVLDTQCNGSTITSAQVFQNPTTNSYGVGKPMRNMEWIDRYRILASRTFTMRQDIFQDYLNPATGDGAAGANLQTRPFVLTWSGRIPFLFTGTGVDVANLTSNALHVIAFKSDTDFVVKLDAQMRCRFMG